MRNTDNKLTNRQIDILRNQDSMPKILQQLLSQFDARDKEIMFFTLITSISSVIPKLYCNYNNNKIHSNLYLYIVGKAGSGKGNAIWGRKLISDVESLVNSGISSNTNSILERLTNDVSTNFKVLTPGNITSAGFMELFNRQNGNAFLFETEGDTITNIHKTEHGNYSDIMRKAFHHETITSYRKTENTYIEIESPRLSILITSTENQLKSLISNSENGLFSRFMFYETEPIEEFINVFNNIKSKREDTFKNVAIEIANYYNLLIVSEEIEFQLTENQQHLFLEFFNNNKSIITHLGNEDLDATVIRMGLIFTRMCMILGFLRSCESQSIGKLLICDNNDFNIAIECIEYLLLTAKSVIERLPGQDKDNIKLSAVKLNIYNELESEFTRTRAVELGKNYSISDRTIDRFLNSTLFEKLEHGRYKKR
jgi:hypothetical protein